MPVCIGKNTVPTATPRKNMQTPISHSGCCVGTKTKAAVKAKAPAVPVRASCRGPKRRRGAARRDESKNTPTACGARQACLGCREATVRLQVQGEDDQQSDEAVEEHADEIERSEEALEEPESSSGLSSRSRQETQRREPTQATGQGERIKPSRVRGDRHRKDDAAPER